MKILLPVSSAAQRNWERFVTLWMNRRNPYTGLKWGEDPALGFATLVSENNLYHRMRNSAKFNALYAKLFPEWMKERYPGEAAGAPGRKDRRYMEFLFDLQRARPESPAH